MATTDKARAVPVPVHKSRSLFDLPSDFFNSCRLLHSHYSPPPSFSDDDVTLNRREDSSSSTVLREGEGGEEEEVAAAARRWSCNTCRSEFDSLLDQRYHFKSDLHRLNVKLSISGKKTIKEEDLVEVEGDPLFEDFDVSSISGSEDELEKVALPNSGISRKGREGVKQKLYFHLHSGEMVSIWRSLIMDEYEHLSHENLNPDGHAGSLLYVEEAELISRLRLLACEPRNKNHLRIVLLMSGGHFAGCVFDGNTVIAHKTFHRYVVRAKAGKMQSSKDATGKVAHSAGSALRRYNEAALKKEIQELLISWKRYIYSSSCIFVYAPAKNRQMFFDTVNPQSGLHNHIVRNIPLTVRRPTLKEAKRVYNQLTLMTFEFEAESVSKQVTPSCGCGNDGNINQQPIEKQLAEKLVMKESSSAQSSSADCIPSAVENIGLSASENESTPLHEAAKSGDVQRTLELLEEGSNPCLKDARGRTPYMLATEKEVRNTFRRYMASNPEKWDWHAADVPSQLTKEMEESQAAKQAEKDAKRKAKAKELKKLRKAKEKAKAAESQVQATLPVSTAKKTPQSNRGIVISTEEERRRALEAEREKRAAAAEKRIAALNAQKAPTTEEATTSSSEPKGKGASTDAICSCCNSSLAGKIPFHRYNYKYCSTTCMHVHGEMLEDE